MEQHPNAKLTPRGARDARLAHRIRPRRRRGRAPDGDQPPDSLQMAAQEQVGRGALGPKQPPGKACEAHAPMSRIAGVNNLSAHNCLGGSDSASTKNVGLWVSNAPSFARRIGGCRGLRDGRLGACGGTPPRRGNVLSCYQASRKVALDGVFNSIRLVTPT